MEYKCFEMPFATIILFDKEDVIVTSDEFELEPDLDS